jgi:hypothetical protein
MRYPLLLTLSVALLTSPVHAQLVGTEPSRSPYRDVETTQQLSLAAGWLNTTRDAAGVGPEPGMLLALRHDINIAGPAWLTTRYSMLFSDRRVVDAALPAAERDQGTRGVVQHMADLGVTMALTGRKSWHHTMPTLGAGIGLTSDFSGADVGGYRFGTKFAFSFGPGVRIVLPHGYSMRVDLTNHLYQFQYPSTYFSVATDSTSLLQDTRQRSSWRSNWGLTTGISMPLFRKNLP